MSWQSSQANCLCLTIRHHGRNETPPSAGFRRQDLFYEGQATGLEKKPSLNETQMEEVQLLSATVCAVEPLVLFIVLYSALEFPYFET